MSDADTIAFAVRLDGRAVESETTYIWAGPYALTLATVLPQSGLAIEIHSTFLGHQGVPTCSTHLTLGPVGLAPLILTAEHEHASLDPALRARDCAYEHAQIVLETLIGLGYAATLDIPDDAFALLERVEG